MQLYASRNIHFLHIITFFDSLLEVLQEFPTLKQFVSLDIGLKCIISDTGVVRVPGATNTVFVILGDFQSPNLMTV
jgi:hypothetical protein